MAASDRPIVLVRDIRPHEFPAAVALLARGFRDNPLPMATYGADPDRRQRALSIVFGSMFRVMRSQTPLVALKGDTIVGVTGIAPPGTCQPTFGQTALYLPRLLPIGPRSMMRLSQNMKSWATVDPAERHSHLGPLAVDAQMRGQGIGTQILGEYCRRLDESKIVGYLETETDDNVRLYSRFGFAVVAEKLVLGVPNWFMVRPLGVA
jgi:ribosomal protein S18 acetylase RimI-like enzyme